MADKKIKIQLVRSLIGVRASHRATVRGLGLRRLNTSRELLDTPSCRGRIDTVCHLVKIIE
jgi:large subunit ribosomal protein L30